MTAALNVIIALAPYVIQLLAMIPGFEKTAAQFIDDFKGHPGITAEQKAAALAQAKSDVDAADDEVQRVDSRNTDSVPDPKPTV